MTLLDRAGFGFHDADDEIRSAPWILRQVRLRP